LNRAPENDSDSESSNGVKPSKRVSRAKRKEELVLNQYENQIALEVVAPEDISVGFEGWYRANT
jgi:hypothetical protein